MPRHLTKKQLKYLNEMAPNAKTVEDIDPLTWDWLVNLNDYETIYQDVNRYLWDKRCGNFTEDKWR